MQLIPEIVIGKRYLWRVGITENVCPECGHISGSKSEFLGQELEVIIDRPATPTFTLLCICGSVIYKGDSSGWYRCTRVDDEIGMFVPYTQLTEIAGVDYELQE